MLTPCQKYDFLYQNMMEHGGFTTHTVGQASDASDVGSVFSPTIDVSTMSLRYVRYTKKKSPPIR